MLVLTLTSNTRNVAMLVAMLVLMLTSTTHNVAMLVAMLVLTLTATTRLDDADNAVTFFYGSSRDNQQPLVILTCPQSS